MDYAWIVFLILVVFLYGPLFKRLYKKFTKLFRKAESPAPLLGVVYPQDQTEKKKK